MRYREKAILVPLVLLGLVGTGGGCASNGVPLSAAQEYEQGFRFDHRLFKLELTGVEMTGGDVKFTFMYTNRTDESHGAWVAAAYLVDNLGYRYNRVGAFKARQFGPRIPEQVWIAFGKLHPQATTVNLVMQWQWLEFRRTDVEVVMRRIPLNWVAPSSPSADVRPQEGRIQAQVIFENQLGEPVILYWLDLQGKETFYREVQPGEAYRQETFVTHSWRVRSKNSGEARGTVVVDKSGQVVRITKEGLLVTSGGEKK